jgi:hypothetical protein
VASDYWRGETRVVGWALAWSVSLGFIVARLDWPYWTVQVPLQAVVMVLALRLTRGRWLLHLVALWRTRHLRRLPVVIDEDGRVHVPVLLPGERIDAHRHSDGSRHVRVLTRRGRVRREWPDAPTRH